MSISKKPQEIDSHNWYYEERTGIEVIHEVHTSAGYQSTDHIKIPWKKLQVSLARHDHKKTPEGKS